MITQTGINLASITVTGDKRYYGKYTSDIIDCQAIGRVPTVVLTNQKSAAGFAQIERSIDGVHWGKSLAQTAYSTIAGGQTVFLTDPIPEGVQYMRVVCWIQHFPDWMELSLSLV